MSHFYVNGERVRLPGVRRELIDGLQRIGIYKEAGVPLSRVPKRRLAELYCREMRRVTLRRQAERRASHRRSPPTRRTAHDGAAQQLTLFPKADQVA